MLRLGVKGCWLKSVRGSEIRQAVHEVARGKRSFAPEIRRLLLDEESNAPLTRPGHLTVGSPVAFALFVKGRGTAEFARRFALLVKRLGSTWTRSLARL